MYSIFYRNVTSKKAYYTISQFSNIPLALRILPLPHWDILEMQWILNRVVAMSGYGAADVEDGIGTG